MTDYELAVAVAERTSAMLWMGDEEGCCRFLNAALREFWGVDPQKLDDWSSTLHPDDIDALRAPFTKGMTDHAPFSDQLNSLELELRLNLHLSIKTLQSQKHLILVSSKPAAAHLAAIAEKVS